MAVAMQALDAVLHVESTDGTRTVPVDALYRLPGDAPQVETTLAPGELITYVTLPAPPPGCMSYRKVRDRASYAFALVSVAATMAVSDGLVTSIRIAFGGVALKPWRARRAEAALIGRPATMSSFCKAARAELQDAAGWGENDFKVLLLRRTLLSTLVELSDRNLEA